jgi:hypothetical protein
MTIHPPIAKLAEFIAYCRTHSDRSVVREAISGTGGKWSITLTTVAWEMGLLLSHDPGVLVSCVLEVPMRSNMDKSAAMADIEAFRSAVKDLLEMAGIKVSPGEWTATGVRKSQDLLLNM